ncbi:sugar ABC transporter substrate-binding protein [Paraburkholderia sp. MMS20-SJTN17]|uniref:sn-glycerol-3-phosphate-binding periplasmic protein UgpB n=1 Tax=Paraburkholderia translucens TaxID=2886945 RepID=A0ABS8KBZ3_9BURK|nr:sugar ABC transporter substrate-binding protein [Paraburkholderia sp. MMS20-SJTN17]MCC8402290.1 sugar ABC transporter substrate-binding protein [Paraburkholderia sp. MMS20-SJTN17]
MCAFRHTAALAVAVTLGLGAASASAVDVRYMLWDSNQMPAYQQCAADFHKLHPDITIKINQVGWYDYWTTLATGFVSGTAPDVFTDHLAKYPEFAKNGQITDLTQYVQRDKVDTGAYTKGLYEIWGRDGKQYGLPKDWDTIGFIVNMDAAKKAGVTLADLQNMTWNPKDGGSFEHIVRKLTVDANGVDALNPKFDKKKVTMYGYQTPADIDMTGQNTWSFFAVSNGVQLQAKPWDARYAYDDPKLVDTLDYLAGLPSKGVSDNFENVKALGSDAMFIARKVAIVPQGSWMITYFNQNAKFPTAWVPLPVGPTGVRATELNGLADSIWSGSKVKDQAWQWVKYMGSPLCQNVVASRGVVFPSIDGMAEKAISEQKSRGIDSSAFLTMAKSKTFPPPIGDNGAQINQVISNAVTSVLMGKSDAASAMKAANAQANQLLRD